MPLGKAERTEEAELSPREPAWSELKERLMPRPLEKSRNIWGWIKTVTKWPTVVFAVSQGLPWP